MTCRIGTNVFVCGPPPGVYRRRMIHNCPDCKRTRRGIERWDGAWYGVTIYCACGDRWMDGEICPRPFEKGWRKKAQDDFRAMWDNAAPVALYNAYVDADFRFAMSDDDDWERAARDRDAAQAAISERGDA